MEETVKNAQLFLGRVLLGASALYLGIYLLWEIDATLAALKAFDARLASWQSSLVVAMVACIQILGGLGLCLGMQSRLAGYLLFWSITPLLVLLPWGLQPLQLLPYALTMAGGYLMVVVCGPGRWSFDWWLSQERLLEKAALR